MVTGATVVVVTGATVVVVMAATVVVAMGATVVVVTGSVVVAMEAAAIVLVGGALVVVGDKLVLPVVVDGAAVAGATPARRRLLLRCRPGARQWLGLWSGAAGL